MMAIARRYELFNGALQIPQFTSEDEVLSAGASTIVRYISIPYAETWLWLWLCRQGSWSWCGMRLRTTALTSTRALCAR